MIGHEDVVTQIEGIPFASRSEDAEKGFVVVVLMRESLPTVTGIQGAANRSCFVHSPLPGHTFAAQSDLSVPLMPL